MLISQQSISRVKNQLFFGIVIANTWISAAFGMKPMQFPKKLTTFGLLKFKNNDHKEELSYIKNNLTDQILHISKANKVLNIKFSPILDSDTSDAIKAIDSEVLGFKIPNDNNENLVLYKILKNSIASESVHVRLSEKSIAWEFRNEVITINIQNMKTLLTTKNKQGETVLVRLFNKKHPIAQRQISERFLRIVSTVEINNLNNAKLTEIIDDSYSYLGWRKYSEKYKVYYNRDCNNITNLFKPKCLGIENPIYTIDETLQPIKEKIENLTENSLTTVEKLKKIKDYIGSKDNKNSKAKLPILTFLFCLRRGENKYIFPKPLNKFIISLIPSDLSLALENINTKLEKNETIREVDFQKLQEAAKIQIYFPKKYRKQNKN